MISINLQDHAELAGQNKAALEKAALFKLLSRGGKLFHFVRNRLEK